ncbi:RNA-directed DNA polymerase, eukaryota, reverse transcriptase zinc-binding domain protein, partial [Tanacetum coccineum]
MEGARYSMKVADGGLEDELGSSDDGIGLDKEESFPSLNSFIKKANNECPENNRTDERRHNGEEVSKSSFGVSSCETLTLNKFRGIRLNLVSNWLGFARVLVEMNAKTDMKDKIELCYINKNNETVGTKFVNVEYVWKPVRCSHCAVFGHDYSKCGFNPDKVKETVMPKSNESNKDKRTDNEGFIHVRKNNVFKPNGNIGGRMQGMQKNFEFRPVKREGQNNEAPKIDPLGKPDTTGKQTPTKEKEWNVPKNVIKAIRKSANKYSILEDQNEEEILKGINLEERGIVDRFVKEKIQPNMCTTNVWSHAMVNYFKDQWEKIKCVDNNLRVITWNVRGMCNSKKQKEFRRFIQEEKPNVCALIETHIKEHKLKRICDFVFGNWSWESNMALSDR